MDRYESHFYRNGREVIDLSQPINHQDNKDRTTTAADVILAIADDDAGPLLPVAKVDAICKKIERKTFGLYKKDKLIFHLRIVEPSTYSDVTLRMFVQIKNEWKTRPMPRSAKLYRLATVALGRPATRR